MNRFSRTPLYVAACATMLVVTRASAQAPPAIEGHDEMEIVTLHAEGVQLYECKPDSGNKPEVGGLTWQFRAHSHARPGREIGWTALRWPELGLFRRKRSQGHGDCQRRRRDVERYPVA
jgi:hypothetical protein